MEKWYSIVQSLQDESENKNKTKKFCEDVFHDLLNARIREKQKFKNRMGPEFEQWSVSLTDRFPQGMVTEILSDDKFWEETLRITQRV
jgi:hypothetical protein